MKVACPLCGRMVFKGSLGPHKNKRPCRAAQIQARMKECGLVPLTTLKWAKVFRWARIPFERIPANGNTMYGRPGLHTKSKGTSFGYDPTDPIYKNLGDCLFVEKWVELVLQIAGEDPYLKRERLEYIVRVLASLREQDNVFRKALMTTHALGGPTAVKDLLKSEGIKWN